MTKLKHSKDETLDREWVKRMLFLVDEYEMIKTKKHVRFRFVSEFYEANNIKKQNFIKYYNRFKNSNKNNVRNLLPKKRGTKVESKIHPMIQNKVLSLRKNGEDLFCITKICKEKYKQFAPCKTTVYNILKKHNINKLSKQTKEYKRMIIKEKAGEMGHIDCHYLPKGLLENDNNRYYLVGMIDDATRLLWLEVVKDIKSLTVMFATLNILNRMKELYNITFEEILTDNGSEFGSGPHAKNKDTNPFERLLKEVHIKHRYTKPYRPQTNGKIERFWRTIDEDMIQETIYKDLDELKHDLLGYTIYYNEHRPHSSLDGKTPDEFNKKCQRIG